MWDIKLCLHESKQILKLFVENDGVLEEEDLYIVTLYQLGLNKGVNYFASKSVSAERVRFIVGANSLVYNDEANWPPKRKRKQKKRNIVTKARKMSKQ